MALSILMIPNPILFTKQPVGLVIQTDQDPSVTRIDLVLTLMNDETVYTEYASVPLSEIPDKFGIVKFDLQSVLDDFMNNEWGSPSRSENSPHKLLYNPAAVLVEYFEVVSSIVSTSGVLNDDNNYGDPYLIIQGGLDRRHAVEFNLDYFSFYNPGGLFLSWKGPKRIFDRLSKNQLYYFNRTVTSDIIVRYTLYDTAGIIGAPMDENIGPLDVRKIFEFQATYNHIQSLTAIGDNFTFFTFQLLDDLLNPITEEITFYFDKKYYRNTLYLSYQNSLGVFDDIRFTGETEQGAEYDKQVAALSGDIYIPEGLGYYIAYTHEGGLKKNVDGHETRTLKANTGYLSKFQINILRELLMSPRVFIIEYDDSSSPLITTYRPVELTEKSKSLIKSEDYERGLTLEFRDMYSNRVWTPFPFTLT